MEQTFWNGREYIAKGLVDGLLASAYLWIFWMPFITAAALPLNVAQVKMFLCQKAQNQTIYSPNSTGNRTSSFETSAQADHQIQDNSEMYSKNVTGLTVLWCLGLFFVCLCFFLAHILIQWARLDWNSTMLFNFILAIAITIIEICFFVGVGLKYNSYDLNHVYNKLNI